MYYKTLNPELARWSPKKPYSTDEGSKKRGPFLASEPYYRMQPRCWGSWHVEEGVRV